MQTTEFILIVLLAIAVLLLLGIMIAILIGVRKLLSTIQHIAEIAQDGTKSVADIIQEVKEKIINPMTMSAIFAQIIKAATKASGTRRRK